ncbi:MAG TPA: tripartite tricarboxylate transporter substrate binding protein [Burkholderiales bacterium]|nr:tripartite tricarboxylate transporter substrate binding protein [Burkholderiales bacterium]
MRKRTFTLQAFTLLLAACAVSQVPAAAPESDFPNRPVRIITPAAPGGTTDFLARLLAAHLTKAWGQQAIVDNRASASGVNAAEITKNSAPDGYTLFVPYHQHTINAVILPKLPYHPVNDFTPITQMTAAGLMLIVNPAHPAKNLKEFIAWSKSTKDPINFGSAGIGSGGHLAGELYKLMTGIRAEHIPYKGTGPAIADLLAGQYHFNFAGLTGALAQVRAGKLRGIAVTTAKRLEAAPEIPAMAEELPGFEVVGWYGLAAPAGLPKPLLAKIHGEVAKFLRTPEFAKVAERNGSTVVGSDPEAFRQFMHADLKKWSDVVKRSGMKF